MGLWAGVGRGDILWFNSSNAPLTYATGGTNVLFGSTNAWQGCYVQLIYAGTDGIANPAVAGQSGVSGDDVVVSTTWVGKGTRPSGFANGGTFTDDVLEEYYVRVWSSPADDFDDGIVPGNLTNYYGDSIIFTNTFSVFPVDFQFGGASGLSTTSSPGIFDSDGDGLPDWWELVHFGTATGGVASGDADGDGHDNRSEFVGLTSPTNAASLLEVSSLSVSSLSATSMRSVVTWPSVVGKRYTLYGSTNLLAGYQALGPERIALSTSMGATNLFTAGTNGWPVIHYLIQVR